MFSIKFFLLHFDVQLVAIFFALGYNTYGHASSGGRQSCPS